MFHGHYQVAKNHIFPETIDPHLCHDALKKWFQKLKNNLGNSLRENLKNIAPDLFGWLLQDNLSIYVEMHYCITKSIKKFR